MLGMLDAIRVISELAKSSPYNLKNTCARNCPSLMDSFFLISPIRKRVLPVSNMLLAILRRSAGLRAAIIDVNRFSISGVVSFILSSLFQHRFHSEFFGPLLKIVIIKILELRQHLADIP